MEGEWRKTISIVLVEQFIHKYIYESFKDEARRSQEVPTMKCFRPSR